MKKACLVALLALSACAPWGMSHEPQLSSAPKDQGKYQKDLDFCRSDMVRRMKVAEAHHSGDKAIPALGLLGYAASSATADASDDYYRSQSDVIDECMTAKGYAVIR